MFFILVAIFAAAGLMTQVAIAQEQTPPKATAAAQEQRWHGVITHINEKMSTMDVLKGSVTKTIHYDSSTKWTEVNKPSQMSAFKEGSEVICIGTIDKKGVYHATRIDLRSPRT
jgi:hypothetical protein